MISLKTVIYISVKIHFFNTRLNQDDENLFYYNPANQNHSKGKKDDINQSNGFHNTLCSCPDTSQFTGKESIIEFSCEPHIPLTTPKWTDHNEVEIHPDSKSYFKKKTQIKKHLVSGNDSYL